MDKPVEWLECDVPAELPVLPLSGAILFPGQVASLQVTRKPSLKLLEEHHDPEEIIAAGVLKDPEGRYSRRNLGRVAVACRVLNRIRMDDESAQVVLQGLRRIELAEILAVKPYFRARAACVDEPETDSPAVKERISLVLQLLEATVGSDDRLPSELVNVVKLNVENGSRCADLIGDMLPFRFEDKRRLLETTDVAARLSLLADLMRMVIARAEVAGELKAKTELTIDRSQREAFLREQLAVIRAELEELDPAEAEIDALNQRVDASDLPRPVKEQARREVQSLRNAEVRASRGSSIRAWLDWVLALPWSATAEDRFNLRRARRTLNARYLGHAGAKDRILEFLAVRSLGGHTRSSILGIMGPPGTGRSSIARTLAEVLGRPFVRLSLRGFHDESEIRGRPLQEIGGGPGWILDGVREAGACNPVILLEHIDRLVPGEGIPMRAVLDALDPERNHRFMDMYLGVPFDLSRALFVVTAGFEEAVPGPLQRHIDFIELAGYTEETKLAIAREWVWPRAVEVYGLTGRNVHITDAAIRQVIRDYTQEAGVQTLRNALETVCRRMAMKVASGKKGRLSVTGRNLEDYLGKPVYEDDQPADQPQVGVAMGLAWTEAGGDTLPVEALMMPGEGRTTLTGLLGEVLQESAEAAISYVRSQAEELKIPEGTFKNNDLHVHFPEGAIPKDGPSAGIAVATAIASALSGRPVRNDVAMTGEISLRGRVLSVGGLREKILAAYRVGIHHVIVPKGNERDLDDVPREVISKMRPHLVSEAVEVFRIALGTGRRAGKKTKGKPSRRKGGGGGRGRPPRGGRLAR